MTLQLTDIHLSRGSHQAREDGMCLLEAVAFLAGEEHSDHPACVHPVLAAFGRRLNDALLLEREEQHDRLRSLAKRLVGTANGDGQRWGLMAADWMVRTFTPAWLRRVPELVEHAEGLERLDEITSWESLPLQRLRAAQAAAWDDAERHTRPAGMQAAKYAVWSTLDAAWDAVSTAAESSAVGDVVRAADLDRVAAISAALSVARSSARYVARTTTRNVGQHRVQSAAMTALRPTVRHLQESALELFERMLTVEEES